MILITNNNISDIEKKFIYNKNADSLSQPNKFSFNKNAKRFSCIIHYIINFIYIGGHNYRNTTKLPKFSSFLGVPYREILLYLPFKKFKKLNKNFRNKNNSILNDFDHK